MNLDVGDRLSKLLINEGTESIYSRLFKLEGSGTESIISRLFSRFFLNNLFPQCTDVLRLPVFVYALDRGIYDIAADIVSRLEQQYFDSNLRKIET